MDELAQWWSSFGDPVLTTLVERATTANLDLRKAKARLREARARRGSSGSVVLDKVADLFANGAVNSFAVIAHS